MVEQLTIVVAFRDRDTERIRHFLDSLAKQTNTDFRLLFIDYGSSSYTAEKARGVVEGYAFCEYIYSDTRGYVWNISQARNTGARLVQSPYLMTTDVDMVFPADFLEIGMSRAGKEKVVYSLSKFLPKGFSDWNNLDQRANEFRPATRDAIGACQIVATERYKEIRGFDEYYRYWGREDKDMYERLLALGLQVDWLDDQTTLFHQWHPAANYRTEGYLPPAVWNRMNLYYLREKQHLVRNKGQWGEIISTEDRSVFQFLDFGQRALRMNGRISLFDEVPDDNRSIGKLTNQLWNLSPGHALAVNHAFFPQRREASIALKRYINYALQRLGFNLRLAYGQNLVHLFLADFIELNRDMIDDYYLDFPTLDGVSILVRAE